MTPANSTSMDEIQPPESDSLIAPPTLSKRRRLPLFLKLLLTIAALAGVAALVVIQRSSNMYWYVSQPIDHDGRRVHILLPVGYKPSDSEYFPGRWNKDTMSSRLRLTLSPGEEKPKITWLQRLMKTLHMTTPDEPEGIIVLQIDRDETGRWSDPNTKDAVEWGNIQVSGRGLALVGYVARRAIPIRGTDMEATVEYTSMLRATNDPKAKQKDGDSANTVCSSMYVK